eukprot:5755981-Prymnesium_polylepis.1
MRITHTSDWRPRRDESTTPCPPPPHNMHAQCSRAAPGGRQQRTPPPKAQKCVCEATRRARPMRGLE